MSEGNVTTAVHQFVAGVKAKEPGTKFDYPPAGMAVLDVHSEYFATNAMLSPLMFSAIGVIKSKLRVTGASADLDELFGSTGVDAEVERDQRELGREMSDDHSYEIGFEVAERPTLEVAKLAYSLLRQQAILGKRLYGHDNPYPPYTIQQALDFLIEAEPRDDLPQLRSANAKLIDSELAAIGINIEELHGNERKVLLQREAANKESNRKLRPDIIAMFKEVGTIDPVEGWKHIPVLTQYKCVVRALDSLKKAMARKTALVKSNPRHPSKAQMENELAPLGEMIRTLTLDCHAVYKANRAIFDDAMMNGAPELPTLGEIKPIAA